MSSAKLILAMFVPGEGRSPDRIVAEAAIERLGPEADVADYAWELRLVEAAKGRGGPAPRRLWKNGTLRRFPRKRRDVTVNPFDLAYRVLRQAVHFRNRAGEAADVAAKPSRSDMADDRERMRFLAELVGEMREAQRRYFDHRSSENLARAKELERGVDAEVRKLLDPALFD